MADQAESLRRWVLQTAPPRRSQRQGELILIHGTEAATGTHTFSLQLALSWRRLQPAVALVDLRRDAAADPRARAACAPVTLREVMQQQRTLREAWRIGPCGLRMISGGLGDEPLGAAHPLILQLQHAAAHQRLLVHVPTRDDLRALLPAADHCVFLARAETEALAACYGAIKAVAGNVHSARCWVTLRQVTDAAAAEELQTRIVTACDRCLNLALGALGTLPPDGRGATDDEGDLAMAAALDASPTCQMLVQMCTQIQAACQSRPRRSVTRNAA
jgi:hypothetical protein